MPRSIVNAQEIPRCVEADDSVLPFLRFDAAVHVRAVAETGSGDNILQPMGPPVGPPKQLLSISPVFCGCCCGPAGGAEALINHAT